MPSHSGKRYTLIIPTYNRPGLLSSLLGYLSARRFRYPIRILDSSFAQGLSENRKTIASVNLEIAHEVYDPKIAAGDKVAMGIDSLDTPYSSFCADDDILLTRHLDELLDTLDADPSLAAAHGYYANFGSSDRFDLSDIAYWAPSITGEDALRRIVAQMSNYQAIFYAVFRTDLLRSLLLEAKRATSYLTHELLSSSLTLVAGGVYRHPHFHMARSTGPSTTSEGWHPYQFLATDPMSLFSDYFAYRAAVLDHLCADPRCRERYTPAQMARVLDLVHLKYLAPMISGPVIDYVIDESLKPDRQPQEIVAGIWKAFINSGSRQSDGVGGLLGQLRRALAEPRRVGRLLGYLGHFAGLQASLRFKEHLDARPDRRPGNLRIRRRTRDGKPRDYLLAREFLNRDLGDGRRVSAAAIREMVEQLDDYV